MYTQLFSAKRLSARPDCAALLGLAALTLLAPVAARSAPTSYIVTDLGALGGTGSYGVAVNDRGQVTGEYRTANEPNVRGFISSPNGGALKDLGSAGCSPTGINADGQVVGSLELGATPSHAFLSDPNGGTLHDLGTFGGIYSYGLGVNDRGQVTGYSYRADPVSDVYAFLSDPNGGTLHDLGTLGFGTEANAVNRGGQVTGNSGVANGNRHAFLSDPNGGTLHDLGTLSDDPESFGYGVNDSGQVAGNSSTTGSYHVHAFLSDPNGGALHALGTLGGTNSYVTGVNNSGQVIGGADLANGFSIPFLFSDGVMTSLNSLLVSGSNFSLVYADGISNTGFITGYGINKAGQTDAFLLTPTTNPVPETSTTVSFGLLLALGLGGLLVTRRKHVNS